jgi:hypothetical protein
MRGNTVRPMGAVSAAWNAATGFADYQTTRCHQTTEWAVDRHPDDGFPVENPQNAGTERWPAQPVTARITRGRAADPDGLSAR